MSVCLFVCLFVCVLDGVWHIRARTLWRTKVFLYRYLLLSSMSTMQSTVHWRVLMHSISTLTPTSATFQMRLSDCQYRRRHHHHPHHHVEILLSLYFTQFSTMKKVQTGEGKISACSIVSMVLLSSFSSLFLSRASFRDQNFSILCNTVPHVLFGRPLFPIVTILSHTSCSLSVILFDSCAFLSADPLI